MSKKYTPKFKIDAIKLVTEQGYTAAKAALALGINDSTLHNWIKAHKKNNQGQLVDENAELVALRKEVRELRMERDILKKATAFFAKESQ